MKERNTSSVKNIIGTAEDGIKNLEHKVDTVAEPARRSLINKFPILFTLLVTLGVTMTFLGLEQMMLNISILQNNPSLMLVIGVGILIVTGTLYKKL